MKTMTWLTVFMLGGLVFLVSQAFQHKLGDGNFQGTVTHVRLSYEQAALGEDGGHPVTRAIVGGLVAGTSGAIIGTAMSGRPGKTALVENRLIACSFVVTLPDGRHATFRLSRSEASSNKPLFQASTLRDGDTLQIHVANGWFGWNGCYVK